MAGALAATLTVCIELLVSDRKKHEKDRTKTNLCVVTSWATTSATSATSTTTTTSLALTCGMTARLVVNLSTHGARTNVCVKVCVSE